MILALRGAEYSFFRCSFESLEVSPGSCAEIFVAHIRMQIMKTLNFKVR